MSPKSRSKSKRSHKAATPAAARGTKPAYLAELRALIDLVAETGISDLEVQSSGRVFRIGRNGQAFSPGAFAMPAVSLPAPTAAAAPAPARAAEISRFVPIKSPLVGTFYRAPAPDADPYVEEGDRVSLGQTVCIVEAMKLMNEIQAESPGRIVRVLIENAQPVEFGQDLFLVDPEG
ncbi:MAG: acetyl-CoA carboxylase biotin carboxyl carrier protein [Candidatus Eisenbacteria bacterium]|nr:acetyl-CoA carboxylase biotin carboxyl carrier protein [Candidatus Eisenbacteria bacterium]